jgi:putative dehydrogenase
LSLDKRVGVIGLGIMGSAIATNLLKAGYIVAGFDVLANRRQALRRAGGHRARSCRGVASRASVVISSLPSSEALLQIAAELADVPKPPRIVIEPARYRSRSRKMHAVVSPGAP